MASTSGISTVVVIFPILLVLIAIINTVIVSAVQEGELNVVFGVMRARGYHLFANAIATSDVHYDIKTEGNFTLFAPINSALFALDMTMAASNYVTTLRYHVVPRRLSISDLLSLPPGSNSVPTLMPGYNILVEQRRSPRSLITVGGVDVVVPGMFYGRDIAVHGLEGALAFRSATSNSPTNLTGTSLSNLNGNLTFRSTTTDLTNNQTSLDFFPEADAAAPPPPFSSSTGDQSVELPVAVQPPQSSDLTQNQTVAYPVPSPTTSAVTAPDISPVAYRSAMHLAPSPNRPPTVAAYSVQTHVERMSREKLLELTSEGTYDLSPPTEPTGNRLQEFTPVNDKTVDCSLADNGGNRFNVPIHARKLYIASTMICARK